MKIAILGTRGIPNHHGGFEQFAEFFSVFLANEGHDIFVYNSSNHPYQEDCFENVNIIHCYDPEDKIGTAGQFIYDLNCILDSRRRNFDIILQLGYTSSSIWYRFLPKASLIVTNMDGLEWKRSKYSKTVQKFLKYAERLAVNSSDYLVADSIGIQRYLSEIYNVNSKYIAYGAESFDSPSQDILETFGLKPFLYNMLIARLEPENNIEMILDGVALCEQDVPFLVIGKHDSNSFGKYLKDKYRDNLNIKFLGGIYNLEVLNNLRYFSNLYFHGHSVGGTNPSLLEAMASGALVVAHRNQFNSTILEDNGYYFENFNEVKSILHSVSKKKNLDKVSSSVLAIKEKYNWHKINNEYLNVFFDLLKG